jgi:hypothetical protein
MNPILYIKTRLILSQKRKQLARIQHWIWELNDQVESGKKALHYWHQKADQLECEIASLEPADQIVRGLT